ncbi:peptidoglycan-associated lipoprotein Pal [Dongia sp.]|uniref:peptidoglycan-associated lipoprotein Pal n=1 Tax=Dongia sp. TaxID=1977262 RepID=UPI0035B02B4F
MLPTSDRSRQMAAVMFASLMLHACGTDGDAKTIATKPPVQTGTGPSDPNGVDTGLLDAERVWETEVGNVVAFVTNAHDLTPEAQAILQRQAQWLLKYPNRTAVIQGHADERGTREYNLALGERRAESVRAYLVALGIDTGRLETTSFGKEQPLCGEADETCWVRNRRAVTALNP